MPEIGNEIYLQKSHSEDQALFSSRVIEVEGNDFSAEADFLPDPGQEVMMYFSIRSKFQKQSARIDEVTESQPDEDGVCKTVIHVVPYGQPMSAEGRTSFRVSTIVAGLTVGFGSITECPLVDVSHSGFGLISSEDHEVGNVVKATLNFDDEDHAGLVRIQSKRVLSRGRFRFGVFCIASDLQAVAQAISMEQQRQQLRRLAGCV